MRFLLTLLAIFACLSFAFAVNDAWSKQQTISTNSEDMFFGTCHLKGYQYSCGTTENATYYGDNSLGMTKSVILKHDTQGNLVWAKVAGSATMFGSNFCYAIACDKIYDMIYITGYVSGAMGGQSALGNGDVFVQKYDTTSNLVWTKILGTADYDVAKSIDVDPLGDIYVAGSSRGTVNSLANAGSEDIYIAKLNSTGSVQWQVSYGGPSQDVATSIKVSPDGKQVITGGNTYSSFDGQVNQGYGDMFVMIHSIAGTKTGFKLLGTVGSDILSGITFDSTSKFFYIAGQCSQTFNGKFFNGGLYDAIIAKYDLSFNNIWTSQLGSAGSDKAVSISLLPEGSIMVSGQVEGTMMNKASLGGSSDIFWVLFADDGTLQNWNRLGTSQIDYAFGVGVSYITYQVFSVGSTIGSFAGNVNQGGQDFFVVSDGFFVCPKGFYCNATQPYTPNACSLGSLCNTTGLVTPATCPIGSYCPTVTSSLPCSSSCICPAGSVKDCLGGNGAGNNAGNNAGNGSNGGATNAASMNGISIIVMFFAMILYIVV
jgi:hypothetical protein